MVGVYPSSLVLLILLKIFTILLEESKFSDISLKMLVLKHIVMDSVESFYYSDFYWINDVSYSITGPWSLFTHIAKLYWLKQQDFVSKTAGLRFGIFKRCHTSIIIYEEMKMLIHVQLL